MSSRLYPNSYSTDVGGRPCHIIDRLLDEKEVLRIESWVNTLHFRRSESDRADTAHIRTFAAEIPESVTKSDPLFSIFDALVANYFTGEDLAPYRAYVNLMLYGDVSYPHRDCATERTDVTVLYYVNSKWPREWSGETMFFDDSGEARFAISPRPGRTVLFRGAIEHRVGIPARDCHAERLTLAYKFKAPGIWH